MNISKTIKKTILFLLLWLIIAGCTGKKDDAPARYLQYADISVEQIVSTLTLEQKAMQMVQPACYNTSLKEMKKNCFGSILSRNFYYDFKQWQDYVDGFQKMAVDSEAGIPFVYGQDDVHGVNYALDTVIFPHNIGLGAANDEKLSMKSGRRPPMKPSCATCSGISRRASHSHPTPAGAGPMKATVLIWKRSKG